jgi:sigma-B regulation protein RsbU (phosphoserine phosphatase)
VSESCGERVLALRFPAKPGELHRIREAVRAQAEASGCGPACAGDIVLAIDEACQNIIRHAYGSERQGDIMLEMERRGLELIISLIDFAPAVDPSRLRPRDLDQVRPGGIGVHLIRKVMDSAEFVEPPPGCGNRLIMVKRIA